MHFINDNGRPAFRMTTSDEFGKPQTVVHVIDVDRAYCLQSELTQVLAELRRAQSAKLNVDYRDSWQPE